MNIKCPICLGVQSIPEGSNLLEECPKCGASNIEWEIVKRNFNVYLIKDSNKYIVFKDIIIGKEVFKTFFGDYNDNDGNSIYRYCEKEMLDFSFTEDEDKCVICAPFSTKNKFYLNDEELTNEPMVVKNNDVLKLKSTTKGEFIFELLVILK